MTWSLSHQPAEFRASSSRVWSDLREEASLAPFSFPFWIYVQKHERPEPDMFLKSPEFSPWDIKESLYTIMYENKRKKHLKVFLHFPWTEKSNSLCPQAPFNSVR